MEGIRRLKEWCFRSSKRESNGHNPYVSGSTPDESTTKFYFMCGLSKESPVTSNTWESIMHDRQKEDGTGVSSAKMLHDTPPA